MDIPTRLFKWKFSAMMVAGIMTAAGMNHSAIAQEDATEFPIAVQMYTLRDFGDLEEQLAAVRRSGVQAIETVGTQGVSAEELDALLAEHELKVISSHVPLDDLRNRLDETVAFNRTVGNDVLTLPYLDEQARPTDAEGWQELGRELGDIASQLSEEGFRLAYHNHDFEMEILEDKTALEHMLDAAGPELLVELDVAWVARGGLDPAEYVTRVEDRLFAVHAKDNASQGTAEEERGFATLGQGVLDWDSLLPAIDRAGVEWYIIEHDMPLDAEAVITEGHDFLRSELATLSDE
ncbi:sugar phosphate isomerase/epimerase family protein [Halomonas sp. A29]|uniref:sugar phosphate isomerase/epimerase family protein n=1 Tax=Halomonas sp. A29 TaxID=3102786 RepID=UPI00398BA448